MQYRYRDNLLKLSPSSFMLPIIETVALRQMASGDRLYLQVYKFIGAKAGKKVYIQS
ncbi:MAG: succinylglutamate desuccinylase, partial [Nostoc sp.]